MIAHSAMMIVEACVSQAMGSRLSLTAEKMVKAKKPLLWYYHSIPIYIQIVGGDYDVFKPPGMDLKLKVKNINDLPTQLYVRERDKIRVIGETQARVNQELNSLVRSGNLVETKKLLVQMVEDTFDDPRVGNLSSLAATVKNLTETFSANQSALVQLASLVGKDYTTALHSVDVLAFCLGYGIHRKYDYDQKVTIGLSGLLHDVGKLFVPKEILTAPRNLTEYEFRKMRMHPIWGRKLLDQGNFSLEVKRPASEHHERIDGSGYPKGLRNISYTGQVMGLIDCYEALTSDERPYRRALAPFEALHYLSQEVQEGKFSVKVFETFATSLI